MSAGNHVFDRVSMGGALVIMSRIVIVVGVPILLGVTSWVGSELINTRQNLAVLSARFEILSTAIYRTPDAERDLRLRDQRIDVIIERMNLIDKRIDRIEFMRTPQ